MKSHGEPLVAAAGMADYDVPVVLFMFNRPETAARTFAEIARLRPRQLFIVADAARDGVPGEEDLVARSKDLVGKVDWPCDVRTDFAASNMGCRARIVSGLNWVFAYVDRAVILEDDCLPTPAYFRFCRQMLDHYYNDQEVFAVSGTCLTGRESPRGYVRSDYALMWGWATWADRWRRYEGEPTDYFKILLRKWWCRPLDFLYWLAVFRNIRRGVLTSAWDYQWILTLWRHSAVAIRPSINLVNNIGFGSDATHTKSGQRFDGLFDVFAADDGNPFVPLNAAYASEVARSDREKWAMLNLRTVLLLWVPALVRLKRRRY